MAEKDFRTAIGHRMQEKRNSLHLTQEQVAEQLDISVKHYGGVERGIAGLSLEKLVCLSDLLGLSLDYLVKGDKNSAKNMVLPDRLIKIYDHASVAKKLQIMEILEILDKM